MRQILALTETERVETCRDQR
uniref:Uncharacterized protein n=1 Tax=Anguilla anguilla TaxID=7936 RepID=A0A0E9TMC8_ANGAN